MKDVVIQEFAKRIKKSDFETLHSIKRKNSFTKTKNFT